MARQAHPVASPLLPRPLQQIVGFPIESLIVPRDRSALLAISGQNRGVIEVELIAGSSQTTPVRVSASTQDGDTQNLLCLTFADLTEQNAQRLEIARLGEAQADRLRELERAQAALTQQATHDALTGLPNRTLLIDRLTQALAMSERSGTSTGLIFIDLDNFKEINDTGGHAAGDMLGAGLLLRSPRHDPRPSPRRRLRAICLHT